MPETHCLTSPSYIKQILLCSKSLPRDPLELEDTNPQALTGTIQHAYLCKLLSNHFNLESEEVDISSLTSDELDEVNEVFNKVLDAYKKLKKRYPRVEVKLESKIDLDAYLPNPAWGYVDIAFIGHRAKPNKDGIYDKSTIHVLDAKFGRLPVEVVEDGNPNPQLTTYWCGIYELYKDKLEITRGLLTILQPKLHSYPTYLGKAKDILSYMNNVITPKVYEAYNDEGSYNPSSKNCLYCKNKIHCKYNNAQALAFMKLADEPDMLDDSVIEDLILPNINNLKKYCDSVLAYCIKKSETEGKKWKGFTLSTGRPTRVYESEDAVKKIAIASGHTELVVETVLTPAQAEKTLGKDLFKDLLGSIVTYKDGKPTLVSDVAPVKYASNVKNDYKENK